MALKFLNNGYFAGKVGIGTESPQTGVKLDVRGNVRIGDGSSAEQDIHFNNSTTEWQVGTNNAGNGTDNNQFYFYEGGNYRLTVQKGGNVGIGTASPEEKLKVIGSVLISNNEFYKVENTTGTNYKIAGLTNGNMIQIGAIDYTSAGTIFAGGDNVSITTGGASGSTRIKIASSGNVGIGTTGPGAKLVVTDNADGQDTTFRVNHTRSDSNVATQAIEVDMNLSGADTTTGDKSNSGVRVDVDSTANGDASNEHRIYGVFSTVNFTGFTDLARGGYFLAESNYTSAKTQQLAGVYGQATHDSNNTSGGVSNMMGVYGLAVVEDLGDVDNAFGGYFQVELGNNRGAANFGITKGVEGHININKETAVSYDSMTAVSAVIDNNEGSTPNFGNQFLFKGDYQGDKGPTAYGIYCEGDKHYLAGNLGVGLTSPTQVLHVAGNARVTGAYYDSNNSPGTSGQVLSSTATGTDWIDGSAIPGVPAGSGAAGQVTVWSGTDVITGYTRFKVYDAGGQIQITDGTRDIRINSGYAGSTAMIGTSSSHDLGFMTGNSQRVTIDTSGNVGIGTTSPVAAFQVGSITATAMSQVVGKARIVGTNYIPSATQMGTLDIASTTRNSSAPFNQGFGPSLTFSQNISGYVDGYEVVLGAIKTISTQSGNTGQEAAMTFLVNGGTSTGIVERMRIAEDGKVGIGTTNPAQNFVVADATNGNGIELVPGATATIQTYNRGTSSYNNLNIDTARAQIRSFTYTTINTGSALTERMRINSSGEVLVNVTSNQTESPLTSRNNGSSIEFGHLNQTSGYYGTVGSMYNNGAPFISFSCDSSSTSAGNNFATRGFKGNVIHGDTGGNLIFSQATNANSASQALTERMRIDSSGNVGIGTTSPSAKLEVTGNTRLGSGTFHVSSDATLITSATYTFRDGVYINNPNSTSAAVASGNVMSIGASSGNTVFTSLITTGAIGIGKSNPSAQLDVVGTGNFTGLVSGITPVNAANFVTKAYVDGSSGGTGPFLPLAGGTMTGTNGIVLPDNFILNIGTSNDLTIKHNATDSFIENHTGHLSVVNYANDKDIILWGDDGTGGISKYLVLEGVSTNAYFSNPGNVGIGTTSPASKFEVYGGNSGVNDVDRYIRFKASNGEKRFDFYVGGTGNASSTSPASKFEVYGGNSGVNDVDRYIRFKASNGEKRFDFYVGGTGNASSLGMYTSDGTTKNVQIASGGTSYFNGGNVGIGTTSPVAKLDVLGTSGGPAVFDYTYATNAGVRIHGSESAMDIVGTDGGNHASTILLRNGNEGFGLLNNPNLNTLQFRSFTATADGFADRKSVV